MKKKAMILLSSLLTAIMFLSYPVHATEISDSTSDADVVISIGDVSVYSGDTVEIPVRISKNTQDISSFRAVILANQLTFDEAAGIGGYLKENCDELICEFNKNKLTVAWGNEYEHENEKSFSKAQSNASYVFSGTNDIFFTFTVTARELFSSDAAFTVSFQEVTINENKNLKIQQNSGTVSVLQNTGIKTIQESTEVRESTFVVGFGNLQENTEQNFTDTVNKKRPGLFNIIIGFLVSIGSIGGIILLLIKLHKRLKREKDDINNLSKIVEAIKGSENDVKTALSSTENVIKSLEKNIQESNQKIKKLETAVHQLTGQEE